MRLAAVTGPVGCGKTSLLLRLSQELSADCGGFVSIAGPRTPRASHYELLFLPEQTRKMVAVRREEGGYEFDPDAWQGWTPPRTRILLADEWGRWEEGGGGWSSHWKKMEDSGAEWLVASVRQGCIQSLPVAPFAVIDAADPDAFRLLMDLVRQM